MKVGILIIGSLYWDDSESRTNWRSARLNVDDRVHVKVPIRYGRKSESRGNTYTIVFSRELESNIKMLGRGMVIPCLRDVKGIGDLVEEAEWLWAAERNESSRRERISAPWGCVGLLRNPAASIPEGLLKDWAKRVATEPAYGKFRYAKDEESVVSEEGLLRIHWPQPDGHEPLRVDFVLATATNPCLASSHYPSPKDIAAAWNTDNQHNVRYFVRNRQHGIFTFEDDLIKAHLDPHTSA